MSVKLTSGITGTITAPGNTDAIPITDNSGAPVLKKITWASLIAKIIPHSTVTTKGDLIAATGSAAVTRLGAGTDLYGLHADSSQTTGLIWTPDSYGIEYVTTKTEKSNSTSEQTLWSKAVTWPLYVGSTNRVLHFRALLNLYNNAGDTLYYIYKFKYGSAVVQSASIDIGGGTTTWPVRFEGWVVGVGATNVQSIMGFWNYYGGWAATGGNDPGNTGAAAGSEDSTSAVTMSLTCTMETASANMKNSIVFSRLEGFAP